MQTPLRLLLLLLGALAACHPAPPRPDPDEAARLRLSAFDCQNTGDFTCAERALARVPAVDPEFVPRETLLLSDYRSLLGDDRRAAATLEQGLARLAPDDPAQAEFRLRLALLYLERLGDPAAARRWGATITTDEARHELFAASLELHQGQPHAALRRLNTILARPLDTSLASRLYYIAARAYLLLGRESETSQSLYHAINFAQDPALTHAIHQLWKASEGHARAEGSRP